MILADELPGEGDWSLLGFDRERACLIDNGLHWQDSRILRSAPDVLSDFTDADLKDVEIPLRDRERLLGAIASLPNSASDRNATVPCRVLRLALSDV